MRNTGPAARVAWWLAILVAWSLPRGTVAADTPLSPETSAGDLVILELRFGGLLLSDGLVGSS